MPHMHTVTIAWGDCDEAGLVFYPTYFYWMDSSFNFWLHELSLSQRILRARFAAHTPLVDAGARFMSPARYDDRLVIETSVESWSARSFRVRHRGASEGRPVFEGHEVRIWGVLDEDGRLKAAPVPSAFREALA
ncbi:4-hydroxybenzoyl-CoA thioesterase [Rhizobiales bacterium GAS113]|nr:4-hydroxybenzoyl-CoA thioesterase [Rhizobiales bacterium GAS113]